MALFGNLFKGIKNAATSDLGTFLLQGTNGLDRKRNIAETERLSGVRGQLMSDLQQAYAQQQQAPQPHQMGPTVDEIVPPNPMPQPPPIDQAELVRQALLNAQAQGLNTGQADNLIPQDAYQIINGGNGAYGVANRRTGAVQAGQLPNPLLDDKQEQLKAQIEQYKAMAAKLMADAGLSNAKAKTGGFAPKSPPRGRASSTRSLPPLPSGKMPIIVSQ